MKLTQNENELIIHEAPGCLWIFGLFFAVIGGLFVYGSLGGFTNYREVESWALVLSFFMGSVGVATGLWIIYSGPVTKIIADKSAGTILHTRWGLSGKKTNIYRFDQVREFYLIEETDDEGSPIWSLGLSLSDGETVRISALPSHSERVKRDFLFQANQFIGKQLPTYRAVFDADDTGNDINS